MRLHRHGVHLLQSLNICIYMYNNIYQYTLIYVEQHIAIYISDQYTLIYLHSYTNTVKTGSFHWSWNRLFFSLLRMNFHRRGRSPKNISPLSRLVQSITTVVLRKEILIYTKYFGCLFRNTSLRFALKMGRRWIVLTRISTRQFVTLCHHDPIPAYL